MIKDPLKLATDYFPQNFHWILEHNGKTLRYYSLSCFMKNQSLSNPFLIRLINQKLFTIVFSSLMWLLMKNEDSVLLLQNLYLVQLFHIHIMIIFRHGSSSCYIYIYIYFVGGIFEPSPNRIGQRPNNWESCRKGISLKIFGQG